MSESKIPVFGDPVWIARAQAQRKGGEPWAHVRGPGPEGKTCGTCKHPSSHRRSKTYYKCGLAEITHGPGSDIRLKDPACILYDQAD